MWLFIYNCYGWNSTRACPPLLVFLSVCNNLSFCELIICGPSLALSILSRITLFFFSCNEFRNLCALFSLRSSRYPRMRSTLTTSCSGVSWDPSPPKESCRTSSYESSSWLYFTIGLPWYVPEHCLTSLSEYESSSIYFLESFLGSIFRDLSASSLRLSISSVTLYAIYMDSPNISTMNACATALITRGLPATWAFTRAQRSLMYLSPSSYLIIGTIKLGYNPPGGSVTPKPTTPPPCLLVFDIYNTMK